jgi:hypothetical protein
MYVVMPLVLKLYHASEPPRVLIKVKGQGPSPKCLSKSGVLGPKPVFLAGSWLLLRLLAEVPHTLRATAFKEAFIIG